MGSIYKITNTINGKSYIGQTIYDAEKTRKRDHLSGYGSTLIKRAVNKYGKDAFVFEVLHDGIIPEFLDTLEIEAIKVFNTLNPHGYNLKSGGSNGIPSKEVRQKISRSLKGENNPNYGKPAHNLGKKHVEETKRKISDTHKSKTPHPNSLKALCSEETQRKKSENHLGMSREAFTILVDWLLRDGWSKTEIARILKTTRNTIRKYATFVP